MPASIIIPELPAATAQLPSTLDEFDEFLAAPKPPRSAPKGTVSGRIGKIAWWWNEQYPGHVMHRAKYELGASDREIDLGFELGIQMSEEFARLRCWYGDPTYGGWPESAKSEQSIKALVLALMRGEAELIGERPITGKPAAAAIREQEAA